MSLKTVTIWVIVVLLAASVFVYFHYKNKAVQDYFKTNGIQTTATVTNTKSADKDRRRLSGRRRFLKDREIEVRYFVQNNGAETDTGGSTLKRDEDGNLKMYFDHVLKKGELVLTTIEVKKSHLKNINVGDNVDILYLPDDIENAVLKRDLD